MGWTGRTSSQRPRYVMATALSTWSTACTLAPSVDTRTVVYTVEAGIANGWHAVWMPANEDDTWAATASTDSQVDVKVFSARISSCQMGGHFQTIGCRRCYSNYVYPFP